MQTRYRYFIEWSVDLQHFKPQSWTSVKRITPCQSVFKCVSVFSFASQVINIPTTNRDWSQWGVCLQWFSEWCYPCVHDYVFCCFDMFVLEKSVIPFLVSRLFTVQIEFCECCVWLQCFTQRCCSQVSENVVCNVMIMKRVICWWMSFVCSFVLTTQIEFGECCIWFQRFTQVKCSIVINVIICHFVPLKSTVQSKLLLFVSPSCVHFQDWGWLVLCWSSMLHSIPLLR